MDCPNPVFQMKRIQSITFGTLAIVLFVGGNQLAQSVVNDSDSNRNAGTLDSHPGNFSRSNDIDFNRDIRPILSNHCFACHGPDTKTRESGLRLDQPDDLDLEELLSRIQSNDDSDRMPPPESKKPLNKKQIELLQRWIEQGGRYDGHWAFQLPGKADVPNQVHPVDYFVDAALTQRGRSRSKQAEPEILLRRVYLDLTGLLPPLDVVDAFVRNPTQSAYEKIVDDLLSSKAYGERWARRWLDLARYADTNGYEKDRDRSIWPYRDWVIRAYNSDMSFDQFTIEQLAGDMLATSTESQKIATGFHRNTMLNEEGGIDPLEYRYYAMVDRVATTGTTWLGMTIGCAQCHTHKYDPISHDEYFSLMAYLNNVDEPDLFLETDATRKQREHDHKKAAELIADIEKHWPRPKSKKPADSTDSNDFETAFKDWLQKEKNNRALWKVIQPESTKTNLPFLTKQSDGSIFAGGDTTKHDTYDLRFAPTGNAISAIRLEVLPDPRLPGEGPGLTFYEGRKGDFFLAEFQVLANDGQRIGFAKVTETYAKNQFGSNRVAAELATDGDFQSGWSIAGQQGSRNVAVFNMAKPFKADKPFTIRMEFGRHFASSLGKFRISVANEKKTLLATNLSDEDAKLLDSKQPLSEQALRKSFVLQAPQLIQQANRIRQWSKHHRGVSTLVLKERPSGQGRPTQLYHRGEFTQPKHRVQPKLPTALLAGSVEKPQPRNRLEFARWLVSDRNPLTARVVVNRQWAAFFGTGLVETLDDFGMQGTPPTHPELLDYLAVYLMNQDWSVKKVHRLIVTSKTYQQSSNALLQDSNSDRWLARFPRRRLEAEIIRDASLQAAGILNLKMYGPPVRPPQPEGAAPNFSQSKWKASQGKDRFRRSIYTYQKRTAPFEMLLTFDGTSGESCIARRDVSNTPLQALTLLNDPMFVEIAGAFGNRMESVDGKLENKIRTGFRWLLTRQPSTTELEALTRFYQTHRDWTALARVMLCLDEAITKN